MYKLGKRLPAMEQYITFLAYSCRPNKKHVKQTVKFLNEEKTDFFFELKVRVNNYFSSNNISQHYDWRMVLKTIFMLCLYFAPYMLIVTGTATGFAFWSCWLLAGFGMAGIGMSVMHDANHGAYSSNPSVNRFIGLVLDMVGGDSGNWKVQHNILHHTYTNIHGHDEDINNKIGMRFSPAGNYNKKQRYQVVYAFMLYSMLTLFWVTAKDFIQFSRFNKPGHSAHARRKLLFRFLGIVAFKLFYLGYMLALPMILLNVPWWYVLLGFLSMHMVAGLVLSIVFQLAHVVENTTFPVPNKEGNIENEWAIHQLNTTTDFAAKNPLITFYVGGLNYQAIHHLFPRICHIHYPKLAPIVAQTAAEYGIPYLYFPSFGKALMSHVRLLKKLGRDEIRHMAADM